MWFVFGVLTPIAFVAHAGWERFIARWRGEPVQAGALNGDYKRYTNKGSLVRLRIGVPCHDDFHFSLRPERRFDRLCKWLRIAVERTVGDAAFDQRFYLLTDDGAFCDYLARNAGLRAALQQLDGQIARSGYALVEARCYRGRLWTEVAVKKGAIDEKELARSLLPVLSECSAHLDRIARPQAHTRRDPFIWKAIALLMLSTGLAVNGGMHMLRIGFGDLPFLLDPAQALSAAAGITAVLLPGLLAAAVVLLGRSARTHMVLLELLTVGAFGIFSTSFTLLRDANIEWDGSPARSQPSQVLHKEIKTGKGTTYYLHVADWRRPGRERSIRVGGRTYDQYEVGQTIRFMQKPGHFGWPWIESIAPRPMLPEGYADPDFSYLFDKRE